jgi:alkylation response protein AidB-like acyl-CoA dehydrogenase
MAELLSDELLRAVAERADAADRDPAWPTASWKLIADAGVTGWSVPTTHSGQELDPTTLLHGYERLASACMTTAFILSQRDAAVRRIRDSGREDLCRELLRPLACGGRFATVGLSQLTTSGQHRSPMMGATTSGDDFILDGSMPWVTGADEAHHLVTGAVLEDGRQVMLVVPSDLPGVRVELPMDLMAMAGSRTAAVVCDGVRVDRRWLLAGPAERVMSSARGGTGGLETSCLALGLAGSAVDAVQRDAETRPELRELAGRLEQSRTAVRREMHRLAGGGIAAPDAALNLRARANALVLRATQTALTTAKGSGFVRPHPAQRWARQALFFLVWSCPRPAMEATLQFLGAEV